MKQEVKKYTITILGESYTLLGDESELNVSKASLHVDALLKEILQKTPHVTHYNGAVLAALKLALQVVALESERENSKLALEKIINQIEL